jgi:hypothetical protein
MTVSVDPNSRKDTDKQPEAKPEETAEATPAPAPAATGDTFYKAYGGESLRQVAMALYSKRSFAKQLQEKNPDITNPKKLNAGREIYFDMDSTRPNPRFLTKDLLDRYAQPLADHLQSKEKATNTATVEKGDTLQRLSLKLYGTPRYWPEIYLVNLDKIHNYDRIPAGLTVSVVDHPRVSTVSKAEAPPAVREATTSDSTDATPPPAAPEESVTAAATEEPAVPAADVVNTQPDPMTTQAQAQTEAAPDPIPEIPPVADKPAAVTPPPVTAPPPAAAPVPPPQAIAPPAPAPVPAPAVSQKPVQAALDTAIAVSQNSSLRRFLYIALIVLIGGAGYYFTRTPRRPKKDMMDLTTDALARPKLSSKDSHKSNIS